MTGSFRKLYNPLVVPVLSLFVAVPAVFAHAHPTSYDPVPNSTISAPSTLTVHFSEALEPKFSMLAISGPDGKKIDAKSEVGLKDKKVITLALPALSSGTYSIHWVSVAADDGHRLQGDYKVTVK